VTGLTNGTAYTFSVIATNAVGNSVPSAASVAVTPAAVPDPPTSVVATAGNTTASVAFVAPTNNGGSAITGYTVTSSPGGITATGPSSPLTVTGLTNGTAYTFTVVATNVVGNSVPSAASTAVTPAATVPGPPTSVVATAGNTSASVAFVAPTNNGGSAITGYTVTSSPGSRTATGASSPLTVTGLTNGTAYTFTVVATNVVGNSVPSAASTAVTPAAPFVCGTSTITDVDNNIYNTVLIGAQCWTKENLKVTKYRNSTAIPLINTYTSGTVSTEWGGLTTGAFTVYGNETITGANATNYGFLYNWYAVNDSRKLCPLGWHVPTRSEWRALINPLGGDSDAGGTMKDLAWWTAPLQSNNSSGFSARAGGYRRIDGSYDWIGTTTIFWSATSESSGDYAYHYIMPSAKNIEENYRVFPETNSKRNGAYVRCLKD
jgi:uncharacterized protein (TIGR02145 family)